MDLISVIIVADENVQGLCETVDALLRQSHKALEILVADRLDNTDTLEALVLRYGMEPTLRYVAMPAQASYSVLANGAVNMARGNYIAFQSPGALPRPEFYELELRQFRGKTSGWCYCACEIGDTGMQMPPEVWPMYKKRGNVFPDLLLDFQICLSSLLLPKYLFQEVGAFDEDLVAYSDYEFLLRLALAAPAVYISAPLVQLPGDPRPPLAQTLLARCYVLCIHSKIIGEMQLKKELIEQLLWDVELSNAGEELSHYLEILREDTEYREAMEIYIRHYHPPRQIVPAQGDTVASVDNCVGCSSCVHHCPHKAIVMAYQDQGFLYPQVDTERCTHCRICLSVCPTQLSFSTSPIPPQCLAVQASRQERMESSSGGVFPLLAKYFLSQGGYVAGAIYDAQFHIHHVVSNNLDDVEAMRSSKYAQSDTRNLYPRIRDLLDQGEQVLFSGCACQIAGLRAFLKKSYDNLYTVDVVCHGVPSPLVFESRLKEFVQEYGPLSHVSFRKKSAIGWFGNLCLWFQNGKSYVPKQWDWYYICFINNWILRESCYQCEFKGEKYSDLTMADFWGIQTLAPGLEDGAGTSYLTVNTPKGQHLYDAVAPQFEKIVPFGKEAIPILEAANPNLRSSVVRPAMRDLFFQQWKHTPAHLLQTLRNVYAHTTFEVGLVLFWGPNHGNALTNYALYKAVSHNKKALVVDNCVSRPTGRFYDFAKRHYVCSSDYIPQGAPSILSDLCSTLLIGSDQIWNEQFSKNIGAGRYFQLDFAADNVRKVAYGASFGNIENAPPAKGYAELYQRFHKIGMREQAGAELCRKRYGVDADFVLDPVFLLDASEYENLASQSSLQEEEPFIFTYFLFPNQQTLEVCRSIQKQLGGIRILHTTQGNWETRDDYRHLYNFDHLLRDVSVEDWLYYIQHAKYVITDSFHATCFSLFFHKDFLSIAHAVSERFATLTQWGDVASHIGKNLTPQFVQKCMQPLDYGPIDIAVESERRRCLEWLRAAIN